MVRVIVSLNCVCWIAIFLSKFCVQVNSTFNFYMNADEVKRILGKKSVDYWFKYYYIFITLLANPAHSY